MLFSRHIHAVCTCVLLLCVSWGLLSPDPFVVVRDNPLNWICRLDDFILHWGAFTLLSMLITSLSLRWRRTLPASVVGALCVYAIATELLQNFVVGRNCDPVDAVANVSGIVTGVIATLQVWIRILPAGREAVARVQPVGRAAAES